MNKDNSEENNEEKSKSIKQPLRPEEELIERACHSCAGTMKPIVRENEKWIGPGADRGLHFACVECGEEVWISDLNAIIATIVSGIGVLAIAIYALANDVTGFIYYAFVVDPTMPGPLLGLAAVVFVLVFFFGGIIALVSSSGNIRKRYAHPIIGTDPTKSKIWMIAFLGLLPCAMVAGLSALNYHYFDFDEWVVYVSLPIITAPIYLSSKIGIPWAAVFMAMVVWAGIGIGLLMSFA